MERSSYEKSFIAQFIEQNEKLPYPMRTIKSDIYDDEDIYIIPEEMKEDLFKELWPFEDCPELDEPLWDIHQEAATTLRKCQVLRWDKRNVLVSEFYEETGGMLIDLLQHNSSRIEVRVIKQK